MIRVNAHYLYELGYQIHPLAELKAETLFNDAYVPILIAEGALSTFLHQSIYHPKTCLQSGAELLNVIRSIKSKIESGLPAETVLGHLDAYYLKSAITKFEAVAGAELSVMPVYLIDQKGAYDTDRLVANGEMLFPVDLSNKVPESIADIQQATKCLAFELPSACGFHLHRATESVMRKYFHAVSNGSQQSSGRSIGEYLKELDKLGVGEKKTKAALRDLKDLHRNPLIHPEHSLATTDDAVALLGSVQATITNMLEAIPVQPPPAPQPPQAGSGGTAPANT